jgi:multidrug efflux pump subunit AcrA (membrane-fusion protein)
MSAQESRPTQESIEQTKQQIRTLVAEISQLSKSEIGPEEYYAAFLQRIVSALAAVGGAVWMFGEGRRLQLTYQINLSQGLLDNASDDATKHFRLLDQVIHSDEGILVPPLSGASDERGGSNPTRFLLVLCPLRSDGQVEGIVEIFQRSDSPPATQRGYLRFLQQMCELAGEWLKTQKLRQFSDRHSLWAHADQFSRIVHESLDLRETAYAVANEGRRLIGCDRVCVAIKKGRRCRIEAISGQDAIENRSNIATALANLATRVVATGEPLWYEGSTEDLPPQIERAIETYVDESYAKSIAVLPIHKPKSANQAARDASAGQVEREHDHLGEVIGALIVEQIESDLPRMLIAPRLDLVYEHSARAIANSMDHSNLFLMPVWRAIGRASWVLQARTLPKTLAIAATVLIALLVLTFVPKDFYLKAKGALQPAVRREVFVDYGGTIDKVFVKDLAPVKAGDVLVTLRNTDLDVQLQDVIGQLHATSEQLDSARQALSKVHLNPSATEDERIKLGGEMRNLTARLESLDRQHKLLQEKKGRLRITSPIDGIVLLSWDVERSLLNRTVETGQVLMQVADPTDKWELELFMAERRTGKIDEYRQATKKANPEGDLKVAYILATDPHSTRWGHVKHVEHITQMHDEEGHTVRVLVDISESEKEIVNKRPGSAVTGKVLCGRRAIGYCWFHEALEWVQANVFF